MIALKSSFFLFFFVFTYKMKGLLSRWRACWSQIWLIINCGLKNYGLKWTAKETVSKRFLLLIIARKCLNTNNFYMFMKIMDLQSNLTFIIFHIKRAANMCAVWLTKEGSLRNTFVSSNMLNAHAILKEKIMMDISGLPYIIN